MLRTLREIFMHFKDRYFSLVSTVTSCGDTMSDGSLSSPFPFSCHSLRTYLNLALPLIYCLLLVVPFFSETLNLSWTLRNYPPSLLFVLRFFVPSIQPQFTHLISSISLSFPSIHTVKCLLLCRSRILVALCLKPCRRVLAAQTYKWTDTKWEKEMKQKAVISCTFIPILFSLCVSSLITRSCCEEVCFVCVGTYWRYHCHVFTCIKEKHSSLRNEKLSWPNFCANKRR